MPTRAVRRRKVVVDFVERVPEYALAPDDQRVPPLRRLTRTELELAGIVSLTGNLRVAAIAAGVTHGYARHAVQQIARKLPGTLPALARVMVWARGGDMVALGCFAHRRIPEDLLREPLEPQPPTQRGRRSPAAFHDPDDTP